MSLCQFLWFYQYGCILNVLYRAGSGLPPREDEPGSLSALPLLEDSVLYTVATDEIKRSRDLCGVERSLVAMSLDRL